MDNFLFVQTFITNSQYKCKPELGYLFA